MAEHKGMLSICDICGNTCFRKYIGKGEMDGGFTTWDKFEPYPEGWGYHNEVGRLCPKCNEKFTDIVASFKKNGRTIDG